MSEWVSKPPVGSQIDWGHPLSKGLVGCWLMNEGYGKKFRNIANSNRYFPTPIGTGTGTSIVPGKRGKDVKLTGGTSSNIDLGYFYHSGTMAFTVECIITPGNTNDAAIAENGTVFNTNTFYLFQLNAGTIFEFEIWSGLPGLTDLVQSSIPFSVGKRYHIVCYWEVGQRIEMFIDGINRSGARTGAARSVLGNGNTTLQLGKRPGSTAYPFIGPYELFRMWNRKLSVSEIKSLYRSPYQFIKPIPDWASMTAAQQAAALNKLRGRMII